MRADGKDWREIVGVVRTDAGKRDILHSRPLQRQPMREPAIGREEIDTAARGQRASVDEIESKGLSDERNQIHAGLT